MIQCRTINLSTIFFLFMIQCRTINLSTIFFLLNNLTSFYKNYLLFLKQGGNYGLSNTIT